MITKKFPLGICPICVHSNLTAHRTTKGRQTKIVIACDACDIYPDEIKTGCLHPDGFSQEHTGSDADVDGCAVQITYSAIGRHEIFSLLRKLSNASDELPR